LRASGLDDVEWNHLARNLFEMIGELIPDDDAAAEAIARVALQYLTPKSRRRQYVCYKTRYNVARCLERCHYSAPRPYYHHILQYRWNTQPPNRDNLGPYAVRGFHMKTQEPGPLPPTMFTDTSASPPMLQLEREVSDALMRAIEGLIAPELPQDAYFFGINCTLALIRWLPQTPDLDRIDSLLRHRHITMPMKQNIFYALFRRYGIEIPTRFLDAGSFRGIAPLSWTGEVSWACDEAKKALEVLAPQDAMNIWRECKVASPAPAQSPPPVSQSNP
jgi:hypothetical protein